jgi:tetratricopeptide (TPR) repeat protein/CHAT domain-containing protein
MLCLAAGVCAAPTAPVGNGGEGTLDEAKRLSEQVAQFYDRAKFAEAIPLAQRVLDIRERFLGSDHKDVASAINQLARLYYQMGQYGKAEQLYERAMDIRRKVLGEEHPDFAESLDNAAELYQDIGQYTKAERLYQRAREMRKKALGERHPAYATSLDNLAALYTATGRYKQAEALAAEAMEIRRTALGEQHADYGRSLNHLGLIYGSLGRFEKAKDLLVRAREVIKAALGEEHPDYALSLSSLGGLYRDLGQYETAEPLLVQARDIIKGALGEDYPHYAVSLSNLGMLYQQMGQFDRAEPLCVQASEILKKALGQDHPSYAISLESLAGLYNAMGQFDKAEPLYARAIEILKKTYGERHPVYAQSLNDQGWLYQQMGRYDKARELYLRSLEITKAVLGDGHPLFATTLANAAGLLQVAFSVPGRYDTAEQLYLRAGEIFKQVFGEDHPSFATILNNLALLYQEMGQYDKAEPLHRRAMEIRKKTLGEDHPDYAQSLNNLALLYQEMGRDDKAAPLFFQALEIMRKVLGEQHPDYATMLDTLAGVYDMKGWYDEAARLYVKVAEIRKKVLGEEHPGYACSLDNVAGVLADGGKYDEALELYALAFDIRRRIFGEAHPEYATSLSKLAYLFRDMGEYDKAERLLMKVMEIDRKALGENHPDYAADLQSLSELYQATNRSEQALETIGRAMEVEQTYLRRVFGFSAELTMYAYLFKANLSLHDLISVAASQGTISGDTAKAALTWVLRRKGIILETLCRFREAQNFVGAESEVAQRALQLRGLRQRLTNLTLNPPRGLDVAGRQKETAALRDECERLEAELNRGLSKYSKYQQDDRVDADSVQRRLPPGTALVEFLWSPILDFKTKSVEEALKPPHYFAFVLNSGKGTARMIDLGDAEEIHDAVRAVRESVEQAGRTFAGATGRGLLGVEKARQQEFKTVSGPLYKLIFAPLRQALGTASMIYLAPDLELNGVPFEALVDEKGRYLVETYRFAYLSSGRDLLRHAVPQGQGTVVFAGPDYDLRAPQRETQANTLLAALAKPPGTALRGARSRDVRGLQWKRLEGAEGEATDVERELRKSKYGPVRCYRGKEALEEVFKSVHSPRVLHVATHGFFLPDQRIPPEDREVPMRMGLEFGAARGLARLRGVENPLLRSGIVLAGANALGEESDKVAGGDDGWVTAEEIAMMDLRGTELVVLSACETGLGDVIYSEGVYGLRRAFQYAGARTLLTSLFKVPDLQTREMIRRFYRSLKTGKSKLSALHEAQLDTIRERRARHGAAHPFFWASFVLVGDPN